MTSPNQPQSPAGPLDVITAQLLALRAGVDALLVTVQGMQASRAPRATAEAPRPAPTRPATGIAEPPPIPGSSGASGGGSRSFQTFDGVLRVPTDAPAAPVAPAPVVLDGAGDLAPESSSST